MVQKPDIQYVTQFYSYGSEAKVPELKNTGKKVKTQLPQAVPQQKIVLRFDPVAWGGILVAVVLVVVMALSVQSYLSVCAEYEAMTDYVIKQQNIHVQRQQEYANSYDADVIREKALALGMVPMEEVMVYTISPVVPQAEVEPTWWENISWFMKGLFA